MDDFNDFKSVERRIDYSIIHGFESIMTCGIIYVETGMDLLENIHLHNTPIHRPSKLFWHVELSSAWFAIATAFSSHSPNEVQTASSPTL